MDCCSSKCLHSTAIYGLKHVKDRINSEEGYTKLGYGDVADAILDKITNNSYLTILKEDSQRKLNCPNQNNPRRKQYDSSVDF